MKINQTKIKKISKFLRIVVNVSFWALIISVAALTVTGFLLLSDVIKLPVSNTGGFSIDNVLVYDVPNTELAGYKPFVAALIQMAVFSAIILAIILRQVGKILKTVENDCPFEAKNAKRLSAIGTVLIISSFIVNILKGIVYSAAIKSFHIQNFHVNYSIDGTILLVGLFILVLAGIFQYGNYLQKEYDATL